MKVRSRLLILLISTLTISGCQQDEAKIEIPRQYLPEEYDPRAETPEKYHFLFESGLSKDKVLSIRKSLPYSQIELERTECLGFCPSYIIRLRSDGSAEFIGRKFVDRIGRSTAEVYLFEYARLCLALEKIQVEQMHPEYLVAVSDQASTILRLKKFNPDTKAEEVIEISDYGEAGPNELWLIMQAIDNVAKVLEWSEPTPVKASDQN